MFNEIDVELDLTFVADEASGPLTPPWVEIRDQFHRWRRSVHELRPGGMLKALIGAAAIAWVSAQANAQTLAKPRSLAPSEEAQWINALKMHKADDGATILEVLQFARRLRPREFKFGAIEVGYNGATGVPDNVGVQYWLGLNRLPGDAIVNLSFDAKNTATGLEFKPVDWPISLALQRGRDTFLAAVDEEYDGQCVDPETKRRSC